MVSKKLSSPRYHNATVKMWRFLPLCCEGNHILLCVLPWQNIGEVAVKPEGLKEILGLKNLDCYCISSRPLLDPCFTRFSNPFPLCPFVYRPSCSRSAEPMQAQLCTRLIATVPYHVSLAGAEKISLTRVSDRKSVV